MMPTAELAPLEPSKGFVEENGVAWPQAAPVHVKTKSAWATNSAMGGGAVRSWRFWQRFVPNSRRFRDRTGQGAVFGPVASRAVAAVVARHPSVTLTDGAAATRRNFDRFSLDIAYLATKTPPGGAF